MIKGLQETLSKQQKKILSLTKDLESTKRLQGSAVNMEMLNTEKRTIEFKVMSAKAKLEDYKASLGVKQDIFKQGKQYQDQLHKQLQDLEAETAKLVLENRQQQLSASQNVELRSKIEAATRDRDAL